MCDPSYLREEVAVQQIEVIESVTKTIGSLALAYPYLRRLQVAETIDALVTAGKARQVATGAVIETLVLNRLQPRPAPISKIGAWAQTQAIEEVYGLPASALNDDRIGRALDEIHPHLVDLWAALVLTGVQAYGVRLDQLHSDVTRVAFEGDYEDVPPATDAGQPLARITRGYSGKDDPRRKQLTVSLSVSADGGVPAWYQVGDGNAADTRTYLAHLAAVREHLDLAQPLVVGDSKLITRPNCLGFCRAGAPFIGPSSLSEADRAVLRRAWAKGAPWHRLDLPPAGAPPTAGRYWGLVHQEWLLDPQDGRTYPLRRLFVHSLDDRRAVRHQRAKELARARRALWAIRRRLRYPAYRDLALVRRKAAEAVARVGAYVQVSVTTSEAGVQLHWQLDHARLREAAQFDGLYSLLTNLTAAQAQTRTIFRHYKEQSVVEGRFKAFKHPPLQVRPLWLHRPRRLESLVFVVLVALFLFALIERAARREVQRSGQVFAGLRAEGRDHLPVTSAQLLAAFAPLSLVKQRLRVADEVVVVFTPTTLTPIQAQILQRLQLPPPTVYVQPSITPYPA
jgi:transposase